MKIKTVKVIVSNEEDVQVSENEKKTVLEFFERRSFYCSTMDSEELADSIKDYYEDNPVIEVYDELQRLNKIKEVPVLASLKKSIEELFSNSYDDEDDLFNKTFYDTWLEYLDEVLSIRKETKIISKVVEDDDDGEDVFNFLIQYDILCGDVRIEIDPENNIATIRRI